MLRPVIEAAAEQHPDIEFHILSRQSAAPLWAGLPANVIFHGADLRGEHRGIPGLRRLLRRLDYRSFDAVADMHSVLRSRYITLRCRLAGLRTATIDKGRAEKRRLVRRGYNHYHVLRPTVERYRDVLLRLGIDVALHPATVSRTGHGIGIAPFAAHQGKIYPLDRMEQLVARLSASGGETVYLFGGGAEETAVLRLWADRYKGVVCVAGRHTMAEELELIRRLRVMVTMDSANMHLASMVGTRVVSLWGATHPAAGFLGFGQSTDDCLGLPLDCRPCSIYGNRPCRYGDYRCFNYDVPTDKLL